MIHTHRRILLAASCVLFLAACASVSGDSDAPAAPASTDYSGPLIRSISWVGITVTDLDRTTAFYKETSSLTVADETPIRRNAAFDAVAGRRGIVAQTRLLRGPNAQLRLIQFDRPSAAARAAGIVPVNGPGITHVCHQSPDDKPIFPKFVAAGARAVSRTGDLVQLRPDVPVKYAYLRDADGTMVEVEQIMRADLPFEHRMRHVAVAVSDIDRTVTFYTALLGKPPRERRSNLVNQTLDTTADMDNLKLDVAWYQLGDFELEVWEYVNPPAAPLAAPRPVDAPGYSMIVFDVANLDGALVRISEAGGVLVSKPAPMDGGRIAFARDLDGNLLGLQEAPETSPVLLRKAEAPKT
jgi:catechol 2,3-dioxygenase-like lactoylglutathione lyase family enzyme